MASAEPAGWSGRAFVAGLTAVVAGFGRDGFAAADNLLHLGARVTVLDEGADDVAGGGAAEAELLSVLGVDVRRGPGATATLPGDGSDPVDLLVVSPGWAADAPLLEQAHTRGVPVWSDAELAWRLRAPDTPWLVVAAPDADPGGVEVVSMLDAVLRAAGLRSAIAGPGATVGPAGRPLVEVALDPEPCDVLAVLLTASQLRDVHTMAADAAVVLEPAADPEVGRTLGRAYQGVRVACVYDVDDPAAEALVRDADVVEGARAIGLTLGMPAVSMLGVVEDLLADRAFLPERATSAAELATLADLSGPSRVDPVGVDPDPGTVRHALAAAALARAHGVPQAAVRDGLRAWAAQR